MRRMPIKRHFIRKFFGGLFLAFAAACVWSHFYYGRAEVIPPEAFAVRHDPAALRSDVDFMLRTLEEVHPDLYFNVSRRTLQAAFARTKRQLDHPMTRREFYPYLARLTALIGDGHTGVYPPIEELKDYWDKGGKWFPFAFFDRDDTGLVVKTVYADSCPIKPGDVISAVNGRSARALIDEFFQWESGEKPFYRRGRALRGFAFGLWITGIDSPYHIAWRPKNVKEERETTVAGVTMDVIRRAQSAAAKAGSDFSFRWLDDDVGYLDFRRMLKPKAFRAFLRKTFTDVRDRPAKGLIIDLRRNGGGSTSLGAELLSYITAKPYRMIARMELKVSRWKKMELRKNLPDWIRWLPLQYLHPEGRKIWRTPEGDLVVWKIGLTQPPPNPLRYEGPVCVLIGVRTFSSAQKLANAIKDYHLATLIGSETGGNPNAFGELLAFRLPHTRLEVSVSTKRYVRANGDAQWRYGIRPDIEVHPTVDDVQKGVDVALERARTWIEAARQPQPQP